MNYHFGGKLGLYREVLSMAIQTMRATTDAARAAGQGAVEADDRPQVPRPVPGQLEHGCTAKAKADRTKTGWVDLRLLGEGGKG